MRSISILLTAFTLLTSSQYISASEQNVHRNCREFDEPELVIKNKTERKKLGNGSESSQKTQPAKHEIPLEISLSVAAQSGDIKSALDLLNKGVDVNKRDYEGYPSLFHALGRFEVTEFNDEGNIHTSIASLPLLKHLKPEQLQLAKILIAQGADINYVARDGYTPLALAAMAGEFELVNLLLEHGANVNPKSTPGSFAAGAPTALMLAARGGNPEIVSFLIDRGADVNASQKSRNAACYGYTPLAFAVQSGSIDSVKILLANGADVSIHMTEGENILMLAWIVANNEELLKTLIDAGVRPTKECIWRFAFKGTEETIKLLMSHGAALDFKEESGKHAMKHAVFGKNHQLIEFFIRQGADANPDEYSLLQQAANGNDPTTIKILLDAGADPNHQSKETNTPLSTAAERGNIEIIKMLLEKNACVNPINYSGKNFKTPLMNAITSWKHSLESTKLLLENGANINEILENQTALDYALHRHGPDKNELVKYLVQRGAKRAQAARKLY